MTQTTEEFRDSYIPLELWGVDHWSTLAYIETVIIDHGGFPIVYNARMRHGRRNFRVMQEGREYFQKKTNGIPMDSEHGSRLSDGRIALGHDDWHCIQDFAEVGLLSVGPDEIDVGCEPFKLSQIGRELCNQLREHKSNGGTFKTFKQKVFQ